MRAVVLERTGGPEELRVTDLPEPQPGAGEVRIVTAYCVLNPVDAAVRAGRVSRPGLEPPVVLGMEHGGRIDAVGEGVDRSWLGRRVVSQLGRGGYADYSVAPLERVEPIDDRLDWQTGIARGSCTHTAWHLLHSAGRIARGQRVLVHSAAGAVGIMATQIAQSAGAEVTGLAGGAAKLEFARPFGADHLVDYEADDWLDQVRACAGDGYDLVLDGVQGPRAAHNLDLLRPPGQVIYFESMAGSPAADIAVANLFRSGIAVRGFQLRHYRQFHTAEVEEQIVSHLADGTWRLPISETPSLEQVPDYHARLQARQLRGRVLFKVGGEI